MLKTANVSATVISSSKCLSTGCPRHLLLDGVRGNVFVSEFFGRYLEKCLETKDDRGLLFSDMNKEEMGWAGAKNGLYCVLPAGLFAGTLDLSLIHI